MSEKSALLNAAAQRFHDAGLPVLACRDWHVTRRRSWSRDASSWTPGERHRLRVDVKGVTLHCFQVIYAKGCWQATVVLDV